MCDGGHVITFVVLSTGFRLSMSNSWEKDCQHECSDRPTNFRNPICDYIFHRQLRLLQP
jgi:hypothetical protein